MSDNVPITPGTGAVIASDDVAGVQFQKIKIDIGGDGVSIPLGPTNPMPVALTGTTPVSLAGAVEIGATSLAALETISVANFPATQPVSLAAPVALDALTLAALETINVVPAPASLVDFSGTVGVAAAEKLGANPNRRGFWIVNESDAVIRVNTMAAAVLGSPSLPILPGAYYETPPGGAGTGPISMIGSKAGQVFTAREW